MQITQIKIKDIFIDMKVLAYKHVVIEKNVPDNKVLLQRISLITYKKVGSEYWRSCDDSLICKANLLSHIGGDNE